MTYSNPFATIASVGSANTPIPVLIESDTEPTLRPAGTPLQVGDIWYDNVRKFESIYVLKDNFGSEGWQAVGGEDYVREIAATITPSVLDLPIASTTELGIMRVGNGLSVNTFGDVSVDPNETLQTLQVNGTATIHTIITGAENGVAINAAAGEITAQWLNIGKNPTIELNDPNYNVSLRTSGDIVTYDINAVALNLTSSITTPNAIITNLNGPRQGVVYKLVAGDGLTFEGQASTHIGGTVGNDYNTNVGTIGLNATVLRTTGDQVIVGDLTVNKGVGPNTTNAGVVRSVQLQLSENYTDTTAAGAPSLGYIANINSTPYWANGSAWVPMTGGGSVSPYSLPIASTTDLGGIKVGNGLQIDAAGTLSTTGSGGTPYTLPIASAGQLGGVMIGSGISVTADGTISNDNPTPYTLTAATGAALGGVIVGNNIDVTADGTISVTFPEQVSYTLPIASGSTLGGIKVGDNLSITDQGVLSSTDTVYTLPDATATTLGGVKVGNGLQISLEGVLSTDGTGGSSYTLPPATTSTLGGVIVGDRLSVANDGTINVPLATVTDVGGVIVGSGLAITGAGVLSVTDPGYILPIASDTDLGGIKVGGNLAIANDGTLSLASDENIELGDGYIRTERSAAADVAYEARVGTSLNFKVLAGGGVAIGGTIDETTTQSNANIFLNSDGNASFTGDITAKDVKLNGNIYPTDVSTTNTVGTTALPFDEVITDAVTIAETNTGNASKTLISNTIDSYERGTWTGTFSNIIAADGSTLGQSTGGWNPALSPDSPSYYTEVTSTATGNYERIGHRVFVDIKFQVTLPAKEALNNNPVYANGLASVTGLPFNTDSNIEYHIFNNVFSENMFFAIENETAVLQEGSVGDILPQFSAYTKANSNRVYFAILDNVRFTPTNVNQPTFKEFFTELPVLGWSGFGTTKLQSIVGQFEFSGSYTVD